MSNLIDIYTIKIYRLKSLESAYQSILENSKSKDKIIRSYREKEIISFDSHKRSEINNSLPNSSSSTSSAAAAAASNSKILRENYNHDQKAVHTNNLTSATYDLIKERVLSARYGMNPKTNPNPTTESENFTRNPSKNIPEPNLIFNPPPLLPPKNEYNYFESNSADSSDIDASHMNFAKK